MIRRDQPPVPERAARNGGRLEAVPEPIMDEALARLAAILAQARRLVAGRAGRGSVLACAVSGRWQCASGRLAVLTEVLGEGVRLMLAGMGVVFVLLTLLVLAVKGMSRLALAVGPPAPAPDAPAVPGVEPGGTELIAAISAAVTAYRRDARQQ